MNQKFVVDCASWLVQWSELMVNGEQAKSNMYQETIVIELTVDHDLLTRGNKDN